MRPRIDRVILLPLVWAVCTLALPAMAQTQDAGGDAGADAALTAPPKVSTDADVDVVKNKTAQVRALIAETLDVSVDPASLFDVKLDDPRAVSVEIARLRTLLAEAGADAVDAGAGDTLDAGTPAPGQKDTKKDTKRAGTKRSAADQPDASAPRRPPPSQKLSAKESRLWLARLDLDRARLDFLALPEAERTDKLTAHEKRREEASKQGAGVDQAQKKAEDAAEAKKRALDAAKRARSEAGRLVAEEEARLLGIKEDQARFEATLAKAEEKTSKRAEEALSWRRRVSSFVADRKARKTTAEEADALYEELRKTLRASRDELASALGSLSTSELPRAGADALDVVGAAVDRSRVDALRKELTAQETKLEVRENKMRWEHARALLEQVESLNRDRLALYPHLTNEKRAALTGFNVSGIDQARSEGRQVTLVMRYQGRASWRWLTSLRDPNRDRAGEVVATLSLLKILVLGGAFFWWRRRARSFIKMLEERMNEARVEARGARWLVYADRGVSLIERVHNPVAWLIFVWGVVYFAGSAISDLYAMQLLWIVLSWTLGGNIVVHAIDVGFAHGVQLAGQRRTDALRYKSLRLVGRVIVTVGLFLALTNHLVGQGTIYSWVLSTCWFAAIPIVLVIVRWWQPVVFERLGLLRKKSGFVEWVLAQKDGWTSFPAAAAGGAYLVGLGTARMLRTYVSTFETTRRVLAYLFRREVAKQARERGSRPTKPLAEETYISLSPQQGLATPVPTVGDAEIASIIEAIERPGGGVFALVGERGCGKSMLLERILGERREGVRMTCPLGGAGDFRAELTRVLKLPEGADDAAIRKALDGLGENGVLLVDDAHRLVTPTIGGLDDFDRVIALARESSSQTTWVFCVGAVIWQYIERARGARPVFDDVIRVARWSEEHIAAMLKLRSKAAGVVPVFDDLVAEEEEDEVLRHEQLARTEASYYRLLWDYATGNPAVAVHFWRESLRIDDEGKVRVQLFSAPDTTDIERLPDPAIFVLRAIVQLELAQTEKIVAATMLPTRQVQDAVRYALFRGYLEQVGDRYRVTWSWFRAITRVLQRRHLLAGGG